MTIPVSTLCIVVRTKHAHLLGRFCTVQAHVDHPFGNHVFQMQDKRLGCWFGEPKNVRVIMPPKRRISITSKREISAS